MTGVEILACTPLAAQVGTGPPQVAHSLDFAALGKLQQFGGLSLLLVETQTRRIDQCRQFGDFVTPGDSGCDILFGSAKRRQGPLQSRDPPSGDGHEDTGNRGNDDDAGQGCDRQDPAKARACFGSHLQAAAHAPGDVLMQALQLGDDRRESWTGQEVDIACGLIEVALSRRLGNAVEIHPIAPPLLDDAKQLVTACGRQSLFDPVQQLRDFTHILGDALDDFEYRRFSIRAQQFPSCSRVLVSTW